MGVYVCSCDAGHNRRKARAGCQAAGHEDHFGRCLDIVVSRGRCCSNCTVMENGDVERVERPIMNGRE
jgi:hypothetical protein